MSDPASTRDATQAHSDVAPRASGPASGVRFELPARLSCALVSATRSAPGEADDTEAVVVAANTRGDGWIVLVQSDDADAAGAAELGEFVRDCLVESGSLHGTVKQIRRRLASSRGACAMALGIIGLSPGNGCTEVLNAGLPPILCFHRDGSLVTFPARSGPVVAGGIEAHPYERVTLGWETRWLMAARHSDGAGLETMLERARKLDLIHAGPTYAAMHPDALAHHVQVALAGYPASGATLVFGAARHALDRRSANV